MAGLHTLTWAAEHAPEEGRLLSSQGKAEVQVEQHCQETDEFTATASSMSISSAKSTKSLLLRREDTRHHLFILTPCPLR